MSTAREIQRAERERERQRKEAYLASRMREVESRNQRLQQWLDRLDNIFEDGIVAEPGIDFAAMKQPEPSFNPGKLALEKPRPDPSDYAVREPGLLARLVPGAAERYSRRLADAEQLLAEALGSWEQEERSRLRALEQARHVHDARVAKVLEQHRRVDELQANFRAKKPAAVREAMTWVLSTSPYPDKFPQKFQLTYRRRESRILIEYEFPNLDDAVPTKSGFKYIKSRDEIAPTTLPKTKRNTVYRSLLASISVRTLYEIFMADDVGAVESIAFNGIVNSVDRGTGLSIKPILVSVRVFREEFMQRNFNRIEPAAALKSLRGAVSRAPDELKPVEPIVEFDVNDPRFVEEEEILSGLSDRHNLIDLTYGQFETLVRDLFNIMGYDSYQTRPSRDGGVDAVAFYRDPVGGGKYVIQAKKYTRKVGVEAVRDLYGAMHDERAATGILVTTSDYTADAYRWADGKPIRLLNGPNLLNLLKQHTEGNYTIILPP